MSNVRPRVRLPETVAAGEIITIRTLIAHPMERGDRTDESGAEVPRRIVHRFTCTFEGETVVDCDLSSGIAANPYLEFPARVDRSGTFRFAWHDDDGSVHEVEETVSVK